MPNILLRVSSAQGTIPITFHSYIRVCRIWTQVAWLKDKMASVHFMFSIAQMFSNLGKGLRKKKNLQICASEILFFCSWSILFFSFLTNGQFLVIAILSFHLLEPTVIKPPVITHWDNEKSKLLCLRHSEPHADVHPPTSWHIYVNASKAH